MSTKDTGGHAFPTTESKRIGEISVSSSSHGMTLRDYFAGQAMAASITAGNGEYYWAQKEWEDNKLFVAQRAYEMADAMIAERAKS